MIEFFILGLILHAAAMALPAVLRDDRQLNRAVNLLNTLALVFGLVFSVNSLLASRLWDARWPLPFVGTIHLACDGVTLFFLFTFQLLSAAGSVYAIGYLEHYVERGVRIRWHLVSFTLLILSLQLVVVVQHALAFLIAWELMAVSAYFSIVLEKNRPEVRRGGFWYFVATHASALFLYIFFIVLHDRTDSWDFGDIASRTGWDSGTMALLLVTGFLGFAIKAGFIPFHSWLPNAHPAAPAHVSGLLSAINIKAGIYGIARMFMFFPTGPQSFGWALLAVALISTVGGVWYALAQHEIKRLLAYHSVENIGIIGLGLAVAWLGRCVGAPGLVALGLAGALLHTLNHAIFKALLFFGAGNVYLYAQTGDIERLGGLAKGLPVTCVGFLIGALSICGLPPFNGFVSEFLIYKSFFQGGNLMGGLVPLVLLVAAVGLAFVGGLAVACFTKLYGIVFLGEIRLKLSSQPRHEAVSSFRPGDALRLDRLRACRGVEIDRSRGQRNLWRTRRPTGRRADCAAGRVDAGLRASAGDDSSNPDYQSLDAEESWSTTAQDMGLRLPERDGAHAIQRVEFCRGTRKARPAHAWIEAALETDCAGAR
jgi:hydrogenase-4 component B